MRASRRRATVMIFIIVISILIGVATDIIWTQLEKATHPTDYRQYVSQYAYEYNIPESVIFAVIKVESDFDRKAVSRAGAMGLMQMIPSTFEWLTSNEHLGENLSVEELFDPETSIKYGTYYLNYLYCKFNRNWDLAFAAYNGGEGNVTKWLADPTYSDGGGGLKDIPFSETKNYVAKVNKEIKKYKELYYKNQNEVKEQ